MVVITGSQRRGKKEIVTDIGGGHDQTRWTSARNATRRDGFLFADNRNPSRTRTYLL